MIRFCRFNVAPDATLKTVFAMWLPLNVTLCPAPSTVVVPELMSICGTMIVPLHVNVTLPPPVSAASRVPAPGPKVVQFVTVPAARPIPDIAEEQKRQRDCCNRKAPIPICHGPLPAARTAALANFHHS